MAVEPNAVYTLENRIDHDPDGIDTIFPYDFQVDSIDLMFVYADGLEYLEPFSMTGLGDPIGGDVIFDTPPDGSIETLTLMRIMPLTQEKVYPAYGPFPAKSHENALDKLTWITQQLQETLNRTLQMPIDWDPESGPGILPPPAPGYTLVWNSTGTGFDNAPAEESFLSWVERAETGADESEAARDVSVYWSEFAHLWAVEEEDVLVNDGVHPPDYSAYHWAQKAEEGGILDILSEDELMLVVNTPEARYRSLEMIHGTPGGMVKLDNAGLVPLDNLPFSGSIRFIAPIEGHDRCPKYQYHIPDETPCAEPDTRNPSERIPSLNFLGGDYFVVIQCDEEPLLNQMNLINPETQLYEIQDVWIGDAVIYLDGEIGVTEPGWYLYPGFATGDILASDVIFDDSMTDIKGVNVQIWNQAADAEIGNRLSIDGGIMMGNIDFMNDIGVYGYLNDATTLSTIIRINSANNIIINSNSNLAGWILMYQGGAEALRIADNYVQIWDRDIRLNNNQVLQSLNAAGGANYDLIRLNTADHMVIGGTVAGQIQARIFAGGAEIINATGTAVIIAGTLDADGAITAGGIITAGGNVRIPNNSSIEFRNAANDAWLRVLRMSSTDRVFLNEHGEQCNIYAYGTVNITARETDTLFDKPTVHPRTSQSPLSEVTVDFSSALHQHVSVSEACTFIFTPPGIAGTEVAHCYLRVSNSGLYPTVYPTNINWLNGDSPKSPAEQPYTIISLVYEGSNWWGAVGEFFLAT